ncbi:MAG: TolB protein, partial [Hyphomicrobiaceae bacterium]
MRDARADANRPEQHDTERLGLDCVELTRRQALGAGLGAAALGGAGLLGSSSLVPANAQTRVTVDEANLRPRPIAIPAFMGDDPRLAKAISDIVQANLERSGLFRPLEQTAFIEQINSLKTAPRFADWRAVGAEALVVGKTTRLKDGRFRAEFRLWDVVLGKSLTAQHFATSPQGWRRLGHIIADQIYEKLTLEKGYFDSRIVFIDETGPKDRRQKRLAIMDQDGHNVRLLSSGRDLVLTPRFSPHSQKITYMSYVNGQPRVQMMDLATGQRQIVGDFP